MTPSGEGGTLVNRYQGDAAGTTCGALRGQLCKTVDGKGNTTSITYDATRNPVTITPPAPLGVVTNTFDAAGRVATSKDGKNQTATYAYAYDGIDRLEQIRYGATCAPADCVTYTYDANGNQITRVDAAGTTSYVYDVQNRPTSKTMGGVTTSLTYDPASNITSYTDPTGTVGYRYDNDDRLIALAEPGGSCPATPVFPNSTKCVGFDYDNNDRRIATKFPNGVKNATAFDKAGRITSITATNTAAAVLAKRAYTYTVGATGKDGALRKTMKDEANVTTTYTYDKMARLKSAVTGTVTEAWTYDKNGNRLTAAKTGAATTHSAYNAADQLCWTGSTAGTCTAPPAGVTTKTYDANGNETTGGDTWNTFNQMTSNGSDEYTYAGAGNTERVTAWEHSFVNGLLGVTQQKRLNRIVPFIRDPEGNLISMRNPAGESFYYTTDALGSTILLTDSAQAKAVTYTYDSWGKTMLNTGTVGIEQNPWRYAGGYQDFGGHIKFGARYYAPGTGRFNQPDPSGLEANRYAYAECNPVNNTDPSGLYSVGEGVLDCATGAASSTAIGLGLGAITGGAGFAFAIGTGCLTSVATGIFADLVTDTQQDEERINSGLNYLGFLGDVARVGNALR